MYRVRCHSKRNQLMDIKALKKDKNAKHCSHKPKAGFGKRASDYSWRDVFTLLPWGIAVKSQDGGLIKSSPTKWKKWWKKQPESRIRNKENVQGRASVQSCVEQWRVRVAARGQYLQGSRAAGMKISINREEFKRQKTVNRSGKLMRRKAIDINWANMASSCFYFPVL